MGSAVGQVPDYTCQIVRWVKEVAKTPVIVVDTEYHRRDVSSASGGKGGADAVSLINTINSVTGIDLETLTPRPSVHGASAHGGYCGPAVKPIALSMVASVAQTVKNPIRASAASAKLARRGEFILPGSSTVQVCTAVMHHGLDRARHDRRAVCVPGPQGVSSVQELVGLSVPGISAGEQLNLNYQ